MATVEPHGKLNMKVGIDMRISYAYIILISLILHITQITELQAKQLVIPEIVNITKVDVPNHMVYRWSL